ncbi:MAG TPA: DoxX-like family protein [Gemmataceae bacterium]|nr:DoxX-like family protein [Gemmataceae bacterium]
MTLPVPTADASRWAAARWLRWAVAFVWLWTGLVVLHPHYRDLGESSLAPLGLPPAVMYGTCAAEVLLALRVALGRAATWVTLLQLVLIAGFTAILSVSQPGMWLDPLGLLTKNLPLLAMIGTAWLLEREGWSDRAFWLLQGGLVLFWAVDGLAAWLLSRGASFVGPNWQVGCVELVLALILLRPPGCPALLIFLAHLWYLFTMMVLASLREPLLWFHPFGPLTKEAAILVGTVVLTCGGWTAQAARRYDDKRGSASRR